MLGFGRIGVVELVVIGVVVLIVVGPRRLPGIARKAGKGFQEYNKTKKDLQKSLSLEELNKKN